MDDFASPTDGAPGGRAAFPIPGPTGWQRFIAWLVMIALLGLGVLLLATGLIVGGVIVLAAFAIAGARSLWRRVRGEDAAGRENVRVIVRR